ncbi:SH3 domain-containing protein [Tellurirhabdus rosea]|uniref:SH3 domain-containing protein n=1 Tax=Tellurirhabdus rosea TaxID=2674997 RepID=UPI002254BF3A|nr:SH3 domain-containing protein [Tellurirhabdus rosea]
MQALFGKKSAFFSFILLWLTQFAVAQRPEDLLKKADSLFRLGEYRQAGRLYAQYEQKGFPPTDPLLLKQAFIFEKQQDVPRQLFYLQRYFDRLPNEAVLRKMNEVALENNLSGYEADDLNYFYLFYKQYSSYFIILLLVLGFYVFGVFWTKYRRQETIRREHKWIVFFYLIGLLMLVNLPERYQSGIINRNAVYLRQQPSAAAPVVGVIGKGNKVNILGGQDVWLRVYWNNGLYYVRQDAVWRV